MKVINTLSTIDCSNIQKEDVHIKRNIKFSSKYGAILVFIKLNNFDTWHLNGPRHLFHSFCCTTQRIFESLCIYEPGFSMDKYVCGGTTINSESSVD